MIRRLAQYGALVAVVGLGACEKQLVVENPNNPETDRVLATPADAETLIANYYKRWHDGLYRNLGSFHGMANVMSFANYSSLANNCQNARTPFTGYVNGNAPGNVCQGEQQRVYFVESEVNRVATSILQKLDGGLKLGSLQRENRARAFAEFLRGVSLGYLAMFYDSAAIVSVSLNAQSSGPLYGYTEVMDSALVALQRAIDAARLSGQGADGFPLPGTWIPSPTSYDTTEFIKLVRSHRARFRANVARTPTERAAANWALIVADAQGGITANHLVNTDPTTGPFYTWADTYIGSVGLWHQMTPFFIGMADGASGYYNTWIGTPVGNRGAGNNGFFMDSPDQRFPQGASRSAQNTDFAVTSCQAANTTCKRYFVNRASGGDQFAGAGWGSSNYDWVRYYSWSKAIGGTARKGPLPFFTKAENDLLRAEGEYRLGNFATAAALVDLTRTAGLVGGVATGGGLPSLVTDGVTNATATVPGAACVPKVPVSPSFNTVGCGTLWDALKYEKRIETLYTHFAAWYLDGRGWGDLAQDTPLFWAVPYQDLQSRGYAVSAIYGAGPGAGNAANSSAALGVYGW